MDKKDTHVIKKKLLKYVIYKHIGEKNYFNK